LSEEVGVRANNVGICYDYENNIFAELVYNPTKKGFFSIGKQ